MGAEDTQAQVTGSVLVAGGDWSGDVLLCGAGLSFWGGVDPETGRIIDRHHPDHGASVAGKVLMMPTSRGSCSGSGVLLELALNGQAPAALIFCEDEEILTLGALVAGRIFDRPVPVLRLARGAYEQLADAGQARLTGAELRAGPLALTLAQPDLGALDLTDRDRALLNGASGPAAQVAMEVLCRMAVAQGAPRLMDVSRGHIDGCILAHSANLIFAEKLAEMGAKVAIPTTINAISVDRENWRDQGVGAEFGSRASRLADAYVTMGARPSFTCAPYLLEPPPGLGEAIGWSESNAVIYANSVLGARTAKHPDYLDLCIAMTGRAPESGVYTDAGRRARRIIAVTLPPGAAPDESFWPLLGWLAGRAAPDRIPLITGLEGLAPGPDDLKALCAAFGTTSGAPMLHIAGHTPEASGALAPDADHHPVGPPDLARAWAAFNTGGARVDLVAIGSPHASLAECHRIAALLKGRRIATGTQAIVTLGRDVLRQAGADGTLARLTQAGLRLIPDLCWCSITEPVMPESARTLMTNSGKYAHYAPGLSGRGVRFGGLASCIEAAVTGQVPAAPDWLTG